MLYPSSVQYRYLPYLPVIAVLWRCPALLKVTVAVAENRKDKKNKYAAVTLVVLVRFSNFKFIRLCSKVKSLPFSPLELYPILSSSQDLPMTSTNTLPSVNVFSPSAPYPYYPFYP